MENMTKDMNNNIIEIGDIVRIANSPVKNDNALYSLKRVSEAITSIA